MAAAATLSVRLKEGDFLPNAQVSCWDGEKRVTLKLHEIIAKDKNSLINCVPAAFTKVCTGVHLAGYKGSEAVKNYKVIFISTDKIPSLEAWKAKENAEGVTMASDAGHDFAMRSGLKEEDPTLGVILRRAVIQVDKSAKILKLVVENANKDCEGTHAKNFSGKDDGKQSN